MSHPSPVACLVSRAMVPLIFLFGLYVLFHGHYSPGGGFQAGAVLAAGVLLSRVMWRPEDSAALFPPAASPPLAAGGLLVFLLAGILPLGQGGGFLDYSLIVPGIDGPAARSAAILAVEAGVALAVAGTVVLLHDRLRPPA